MSPSAKQIKALLSKTTFEGGSYSGSSIKAAVDGAIAEAKRKGILPTKVAAPAKTTLIEKAAGPKKKQSKFDKVREQRASKLKLLSLDEVKAKVAQLEKQLAEIGVAMDQAKMRSASVTELTSIAGNRLTVENDLFTYKKLLKEKS